MRIDDARPPALPINAATIEFLANRESRNITGQIIAPDGGWTAC